MHYNIARLGDPTPLQQLDALLQNAVRGATPARMVIAGDSAGGGLTVATLVALRDAGDPLPAAGVCLSPWVDLEGIVRR